MKDVIIVGAGGHAAEIDEYIFQSNKDNGLEDFNIVGFLDDNPDNYKHYKFSAPLIGGIEDHNIKKGQLYIIGIASMDYRRKFVELFRSEGAQFASFVHPSANISRSATIGEGSIIGPNANLGPNVRVGRYTLINSRCSVGHDTILGDYNFISPNVCFSGFTSIGDENLFGINSATVPGIKIGSGNKITAGMIVNQNVGDKETLFYRYKEKIIAVPKRK